MTHPITFSNLTKYLELPPDWPEGKKFWGLTGIGPAPEPGTEVEVQNREEKKSSHTMGEVVETRADQRSGETRWYASMDRGLQGLKVKPKPEPKPEPQYEEYPIDEVFGPQGGASDVPF